MNQSTNPRTYLKSAFLKWLEKRHWLEGPERVSQHRTSIYKRRAAVSDSGPSSRAHTKNDVSL